MADKWGDSDFDKVPAGPLKGRPWRDVPALTLHGLLLAVDFGIADNLDERRVWAIHEGLRAKDDPRAQQLVLDLHNAPAEARRSRSLQPDVGAGGGQ